MCAKPISVIVLSGLSRSLRSVAAVAGQGRGLADLAARADVLSFVCSLASSGTARSDAASIYFVALRPLPPHPPESHLRTYHHLLMADSDTASSIDRRSVSRGREAIVRVPGRLGRPSLTSSSQSSGRGGIGNIRRPSIDTASPSRPAAEPLSPVRGREAAVDPERVSGLSFESSWAP